jgi:transporter family-2 protein
MGRVPALLLMVTVGSLLAFQPGINTQLAKRTSQLVAVCASTAIAAIVLAVVVVLAGQTAAATRVVRVPPFYLVGGLLTVALVFAMLKTLPVLGAAGLVASAVTGQLAVSAALDHFGVLDTDRVGFTPLRGAGIVLLLAGTILVTSR